MKLTLVSPRLAVQKGDFLGSGVPYWPVELAVTAAYLRSKGNEISIWDLFGSSPTTFEEKSDHYLQGQPLSSFLSKNEKSETDAFLIFAISYMSHREILSIISEIRESHPLARICVLENSQAVTAYSLPELSKDFFNTGADALLCGEIYFNWQEIQNYLLNSSQFEPPENVVTSKSIPPLSPKRKILKHPSYPPPAWELFNLEGYWNLPYSHGPKRTRKFLPILTSRGCPYPCDFCVVPTTNSQRWRGRSAEEVAEEIIYLRDKFDVHYFQIEDLNPTVQSERWEEISRILIKREAKVHFAFVSGTKAETVKVEQIPLLARAGCYYISISPESGSAAVLKAIGKPFDYDHALRLVRACSENGIYTQACILVGHPSETEADHKLSCDYLKKLVRSGLSEVAIFIVSSLAGSKIYERQAIALHSNDALPSFSPKGRKGFHDLERRRKELIRIFFIEKLKKGPALWLQGLRALFGVPRTKMENLPRRAALIHWLLLKRRFLKKRVSA